MPNEKIGTLRGLKVKQVVTKAKKISITLEGKLVDISSVGATLDLILAKYNSASTAEAFVQVYGEIEESPARSRKTQIRINAVSGR